MNNNRKGITLVGNILTDVVKTVDCYPEIGMLANIKDVSMAVGGSVPNTGIDIKKIDSSMPISSPLLKSIPHGLYRKRIDCHQNLIAKLTDGCFGELADNEQYKQLLKAAGI